MIFDPTTRKLTPETPDNVIAKKSDHTVHGTPAVYLAIGEDTNHWEEISRPEPEGEINNEDYAR